MPPMAILENITKSSNLAVAGNGPAQVCRCRNQPLLPYRQCHPRAGSTHIAENAISNVFLYWYGICYLRYGILHSGDPKRSLYAIG